MTAVPSGEQRLRRMLDAVPDQAVVVMDAQGVVVDSHPGVERLTGYPADELRGRHFSLFFADADVEAGRPALELAAALREGRWTSEGWRQRKDGTRYWASVVLVVERDDAGRACELIEVTRDLTERKQQQDLLARVAELSPIAMLLVDSGGRIRYLNAQAAAMFRSSREALDGQPIHRLIPERFHAMHGAHMSRFWQNVSSRPMGVGRDLLALRADGSEIEVEVGLSGIDTSEGQAVLAAVVDVSERRRQQRATERAVAEKDTLLKEVYHRVKNNLQVVQSLLGMQRRVLPEGPARAALDDSVLRVRAMAMVHERLYQAENLAAVPLRDYFADLLQHIEVASGARARGIRIEADVAAMDTGLDAAVPLGLLLVELVTNSLKHGFGGGRSGRVSVQLGRHEGVPRLCVTDEGQGLPEGFALERPRSLGLQLATSLARQLGGELRVEPAAGARFVATLPRL